MKSFSLQFVFILFFSLSIQAQTTISGNVTDIDSGEPLPGVNVYISGTTIGASTDNNGFYNFSTNLIGRQDLVASFIGFKTQIKPFKLGEKSTVEYSFSLKTDILELNEIRVVASNNEFLRQLDLFNTFFIGFDSNADQTKIINPEVLDFIEEDNRDRITVHAGAPLIIQNNALGYIYEVEIQQAFFNPKDNTGLYKIYPRIIEMDPPNRRIQRRWNSNRRDSYEGSSRHFFKSLTEDKLRRNKFRVVPSENVFVNYSDSLEYMRKWFPNNWEYIKANFHVFLFDTDALRIEYIYGRASGIAQQYTEPKVSSIRVQGFPEIIVINDNGLLLDSQKIALFGEWSNTRFSDFLPLDYSN